MKKLFQKIGGLELARNRREDTKRIKVNQFYGSTNKNTFPAITFKKIVSKNWRARANSKKKKRRHEKNSSWSILRPNG